MRWDNSALMLGKWKVGGTNWDSCLAAGTEEKYRAWVLLPGMKESLGHFKTEAEAKERVEKAVSRWLEEAGLAIP
jgi:hypothetical protein